MLRPKRRGRGLLAFAAGSRASHSSDDPLLRLCTAVSACSQSCGTFVSAAPSMADRSARPGREIPMPGLRPRRTRGPWRGKGYTSPHAASGLETLAICRGRGVCDIFVAIPSSFNTVSVTTELLTTGLVGPLRSLSANSREQEYEQAATSCSHCNSLIQHAPLRYR